ncbi:MAG: glycosyltransferase family 87 protein [Candidatus Acidiferrales bacterium]
MRKRVQLDRRVVYSFMFLMMAVNAAVFFISWKDIMTGKNDFPVFYSNAQMVREGRAAYLYDFAAENIFVHRVSDVTRAPNNHLPYELLIFIPFTYLRFGAAHLLWTFVSLGMLVGVALLMCNTLSAGLSLRPTLLTTLAFFPVWYCLLQGQDSILLVLLFAISFWLWKRGREDAAGFTLAMGLFPSLFSFCSCRSRWWECTEWPITRASCSHRERRDPQAHWLDSGRFTWA